MLAETRRCISETVAGSVDSAVCRPERSEGSRFFAPPEKPRFLVASHPRNDKEINDRKSGLSSSQQVLGDEENVGRALRKAPHQVGIPLCSERDVDAHSPAVASQALL